MYNVILAVQYCDNCRITKNKGRQRKYHKKTFKSKYSLKELENNFLIVTDQPFKLIPKGFNEYSSIKAQSYTNYFNMSWCDIVKYYGKLDILYNYLINELIEYNKKTGLHGIRGFIDQHKYITSNITKYFSVKQICNDCNFQYIRYIEEDLVNNFNDLRKYLGHIPTYNEFMELSKITIRAYKTHYNLYDNNRAYDNLVKNIVKNENDFNTYLKNKRKRKLEILKNNGLNNFKYSDKDLEENFKNIFETFYTQYNGYPTSKYFARISNIDESIYRQRLNMNWTQICEYYGYKITKGTSFENVVLESIKQLTGVDYFQQIKFDWLRSIKDYPLIVDGVFEDIKLCVETDGKQHKAPVGRFGGYKAFKVRKKNDHIKDIEIPKHGYKLIRIDIDSPWHDLNYLRDILIQNDIPVVN